jgi:hypothetical protein
MKETKPVQGVGAPESIGAEPAKPRTGEPAAQSEDALPKSRRPHPDGVSEAKPLRSQSKMRTQTNMRTQTSTRKIRGRLDRDVMQKLGMTLQAYLDDVRKEGVPDRFKELLQQLDARKNKESS